MHHIRRIINKAAFHFCSECNNSLPDQTYTPTSPPLLSSLAYNTTQDDNYNDDPVVVLEPRVTETHSVQHPPEAVLESLVIETPSTQHPPEELLESLVIETTSAQQQPEVHTPLVNDTHNDDSIFTSGTTAFKQLATQHQVPLQPQASLYDTFEVPTATETTADTTTEAATATEVATTDTTTTTPQIISLDQMLEDPTALPLPDPTTLPPRKPPVTCCNMCGLSVPQPFFCEHCRARPLCGPCVDEHALSCTRGDLRPYTSTPVTSSFNTEPMWAQLITDLFNGEDNLPTMAPRSPIVVQISSTTELHDIADDLCDTSDIFTIGDDSNNDGTESFPQHGIFVFGFQPRQTLNNNSSNKVYTNVRGRGHAGLIIDPGASRGIIGSDSLLAIIRAVHRPRNLERQITYTKSNSTFSGINAGSSRSCGFVSFPIGLLGIGNARFGGDILGEGSSTCPGLIPLRTLIATGCILSFAYFSNGDGLLGIKDQAGHVQAQRLLLTESGHYLLTIDHVGKQHNKEYNKGISNQYKQLDRSGQQLRQQRHEITLHATQTSTSTFTVFGSLDNNSDDHTLSDYWHFNEQDHIWVCHHVLQRQQLLDPELQPDGPDINSLLDLRTTKVHYDDDTEENIHDTWRDQTQLQRQLTRTWIGYTIFHLHREPDPQPQVFQ